MLYDGDVYTVKLSVKEYAGERRLELDSVKKLYDTKLEKKELLSSSDRLAKSQGVHLGNSSSLKVRQLISGVKDNEGALFDTFFQSNTPQVTPDTARGAFVQRPLDGQAMIALFKGKKDISTVIHEGAGHMFLENLREAASSDG